MIIPEGDPQSRADRDALELALHALGWIPGRNVDLNYRWSDGDETLLRKYGAELVATSPDVLMTEGTAAFAAVKRKTKSIPTIFVNVSDPVGQGFVASLAHPGGNTTGFTLFEFSMGTKWVEILRELAPTTKHIGFKQATSTIPIVFALAADPVGSGLVANLARPGAPDFLRHRFSRSMAQSRDLR
jgi:putative tryptophan/tyrosine transport system substrate-binding protein